MQDIHIESIIHIEYNYKHQKEKCCQPVFVLS